MTHIELAHPPLSPRFGPRAAARGAVRAMGLRLALITALMAIWAAGEVRAADFAPAHASLLEPALADASAERARLRRGDALPNVFRRAGVGVAEAHRAARTFATVFDTRRLRAGQEIELFLQAGADDARLVGFAITPEPGRTIHVARRWDGGFIVRDLRQHLERRTALAVGEITESLYADAKAAGAHDATIAQIADLLAYSVDFQREIRPGDEFEILFDEWVNAEGERVRVGDLQYVRFTPRGRELAYWRFNPGDRVGFYDAKGESARRFLMKTPINGARLSSHFGRRRHPIRGYTRMHRGTDFAAPTGTPIFAAGSGVVERADRWGSYGNYVRIRHDHGYKTAYAHLSRFHSRTRPGRRVRQGQVIGYVGSTGGSTGPHLHYEVIRNGRHINPMSLRAPTGRTLTAEEKERFDAERARLDVERVYLHALRDRGDAHADASQPTLIAQR